MLTFVPEVQDRIAHILIIFHVLFQKCERYWPEVHETLTYGKYEVTNVFENELPSYTVRHLSGVHVRCASI